MTQKLVSRKKRAAYKQGLRVHLHDECPRIGSGWRIVIPSVGRKWVRIVEVSTGRGARLKRPTWEQIAK